VISTLSTMGSNTHDSFSPVNWILKGLDCAFTVVANAKAKIKIEFFIANN